MIVVASTNGMVGIKDAMDVLKAGGSALDAIEAGIHKVESNPDDDSVGYGGIPNILGEVELDASIMDGTNLTSGAVGAIKGYEHPISIARKVMETLPHVFLVGTGAERFAAEMGFTPCDLLTDRSRQTWMDGLRNGLPAEVIDRLAEQKDLSKWVVRMTDPTHKFGTVNFLVQDGKGNICSGVSTSGWSWKYPGRLGDSPIIGAGNYADSRYGAAACTGMGEMAIRAGTARSVVLYMKMGMSIEEAGRTAMADLDDLGGNYLDRMNIIALDKDGTPAGFTNYPDATYIYMTDAMEEPVIHPRILIATHRVWGNQGE